MKQLCFLSQKSNNVLLNNSPNLKINTIANIAGQIYAIFIGIIILPLYLKYLGQEAFGLIGFFYND